MARGGSRRPIRSEEHTSELQSPCNVVCRLLLGKKDETTGGMGVLLLDDGVGCTVAARGRVIGRRRTAPPCRGTALPPALRPPSAVSFFNDTATTEIYTLSLHDALPIYAECHEEEQLLVSFQRESACRQFTTDRKSTRLNSSHLVISHAVFCLKKKQ